MASSFITSLPQFCTSQLRPHFAPLLVPFLPTRGLARSAKSPRTQLLDPATASVDRQGFPWEGRRTIHQSFPILETTVILGTGNRHCWHILVEAIGKILARGHNRVPVYSENPNNIVGLLLVESLLTVRGETETPVSAFSIRKMPRVPYDMPLYDILNEFQKGSSHMAADLKSKRKPTSLAHDGKHNAENSLVLCDDQNPESVTIEVGKLQSKMDDIEKPESLSNNSLTDTAEAPSEANQYEEVIGIITLEDVFEELLQEEIVDETDEYVDVHKRIRVAAAAAVTSIARSPSIRRLASNKVRGMSLYNINKTEDKHSNSSL